MSIIVQDWPLVSNANSYGDEAGLIAYALARGKTIDPDTAEKHLIVGMDWFEMQSFPGIKTTETQTTQWPRKNVRIDGYLIDDEEVPLLAIECQYEAAIADSEGYNQLAARERTVKRIQVGSISKEYADNSSSRTVPVALFNKLYKLQGDSANNGFSFDVSPA